VAPGLPAGRDAPYRITSTGDPGRRDATPSRTVNLWCARRQRTREASWERDRGRGRPGGGGSGKGEWGSAGGDPGWRRPGAGTRLDL